MRNAMMVPHSEVPQLGETRDDKLAPTLGIIVLLIPILFGIIVTVIGLVGWSQGGDIGFQFGLLVMIGALITVCSLGVFVGPILRIRRTQERYRLNTRLYEEQKPHINDRYCVYCNYDIGISGSRFCPNCGASLITIRAGTDIAAIRSKVAVNVSPVSVSETLGTCPICKYDILRSDPVASCPYCGTLAHRVHLLEYLHVKGDCPSCGKRLSEKEIKEHLARAETRIGSKKRVG
ncbi:MAG: hypothetical protein WED04_09105 [Promethearchaeati archaeon SRVP18_Atabeyarchaeia-1]